MMTIRVLGIFLLLLLQGVNLQGQQFLDIPVPEQFVDVSLDRVLVDIQSSRETKIYFLSEWIDQYKITAEHVGRPWGEALDMLFSGADITYIEMYPDLVVIVKDPAQQIARRKTLEDAVSTGKQLDNYVIGESGAQPRGTRLQITGRLQNWNTDEAIPFVPIAVNGGAIVVSTDENGGFLLDLTPGEYLISISYLGFVDKVINLIVHDGGLLDITLEESYTTLEEVVIQGEQTVEMSSADIGKQVLDIQSIKRAPALLGSPDILKQIETLAGVTSVGEASSGFNVRGGSVDQNLVLYDGIPQFNNAHALGFLNGFNADVIQRVTFLKGGIPAKYGGRASSILDIRSSDGQKDKWRGRAGFGLLTSYAAINGPVKKDKSSLSGSVRTTYSDWLMRTVDDQYQDLSESTVGFVDASAKYHTRLDGDRDFRVSGYWSYDEFGLTVDTSYSWSNAQLSFNYSTPISTSIKADYTLGANRYGYTLNNKNYLTAALLRFNVSSITGLADYNWKKGDHNIDFGFQARLYRFVPGQLTPNTPVSNAREINLDHQTVLENALYVSDQLQIKDHLFITAGLRFPFFFNFGPEEVNIFEENSPRGEVDIIDQLSFGSGQITKSYMNLEPRLALRYALSPKMSLKLGYNRLYQYIHLISNTTSITPIDIWKPSDYHLRPQQADQISAGISGDIGQENSGFNAEVFYKKMENVVDFKDGARLILNDNLDTELLQGSGRAYGVELSIQKPKGRLSGTFNYTYSRSFRTFDSPIQSRSINRGLEYPSNFDQPHSVNLNWKYSFSRRYLLTGAFTYRKGRPVTVPVGAFEFEQQVLALFSGRNQYRIPDYHRLDIAFVIESNHKRSKKAKSNWSLSIYNLYGRRNPYSIFFRNADNGIPSAYRLAVIGIPLPSISYNLVWE